MRQAKAAFQALPETMRTYLNDATELTVMEIVRFAKARVLASPSVRTRALYNAIGWTMNRNNGRGKAGVQSVSTTLKVNGQRLRVKGIVTAGKGGSASRAAGARITNPRRYAHLVEFGSRRQAPEPFMVPAAQDQKAPYLDRCRRAGKQTEQSLASIGGRTL